MPFASTPPPSTSPSMSKPAVLKTVNTSLNAPTDATVKGGQIQKVPLAKSSVKTSSKEYSQNMQPKKISHKTSKPILTWFQRKLAGSSKGKRGDSIALGPAQGTSRGRTVSATLPRPSIPKQFAKRDNSLGAHRATLSLTDDERGDYAASFDDDNGSVNQSVFTRESLWSPQSTLEADDDASVRPIPPSAPPSPSPSRSNSSVLSDPRTFRSMAASTKPTTVLSIELGNGMAHIAQVPPNGNPNPVHRIAPHIRNSSLGSTAQMSSGNSVTFSPLPTSTPLQTPSVRNFGSNAPPGSYSHVQAPLHTSHHPRNNPRPSSPPLDNASMLTLASSAYAIPMRGSTTRAYSITTSILGDNASYYQPSMAPQDGESTSQFVLGDDDRLDDRDIDASVRALRPRSSRRGSWESEASGWSARIVGGGPGTPSLTRERSLWAPNSARGANANGDGAEQTKEEDQEDNASVDEKPTSAAHPHLDGPESVTTTSAQLSSTKPEPTKGTEANGDDLKLPEHKPLRRPSIETIGNPETKDADPTPALPVPSLPHA